MIRLNSLKTLAAATVLLSSSMSAQAIIIELNQTPFTDPSCGNGGEIACFTEYDTNGIDEISIEKDINALATPGSIVFSGNLIVSGGGSTFEVSETITNNSGIDWLDYHISFVFVGETSLDTAVITGASGSIFQDISFTDNSITFLNGLVDDEFELSFTVSTNLDNGGSFQISQWPSIDGGNSGNPTPEPTTLALLGLGLAGMNMRRRRASR